MTKEEISDFTKQLIIEGKFKEACTNLTEYVDGIDKFIEEDLMIQVGIYNQHQREFTNKQISKENYDMALSRIRYAISQIMDRLPEKGNTVASAQQATGDQLTNILFLSANPKNTSQLRLGEELRKIKDSLAASTYRHKFELISESAVRVPTITKALQQQRPEIVHFAGHGLGEDGIIVENDLGDIVKFPTSGLDRLFKLFSKEVKCVVLNACYSEEQAKVISQHGIYVVGMNKAIGDKAALDFSVGFYQSLGEGNSFQFAYDMAMVNNSVNKRDAKTPELWLDGKLISE